MKNLLRKWGLDWVDVTIIAALIIVTALVFVPWERWFQ